MTESMVLKPWNRYCWDIQKMVLIKQYFTQWHFRWDIKTRSVLKNLCMFWLAGLASILDSNVLTAAKSRLKSVNSNHKVGKLSYFFDLRTQWTMKAVHLHYAHWETLIVCILSGALVRSSNYIVFQSSSIAITCLHSFFSTVTIQAQFWNVTSFSLAALHWNSHYIADKARNISRRTRKHRRGSHATTIRNNSGESRNSESGGGWSRKAPAVDRRQGLEQSPKLQYN